MREVLRDIGFVAKPGEILALFGPSGAGKSTTLRIVTGLDTRFSGSVRNSARRTGMLFQEPRLLPWLTTGGNIRLVRADGSSEPDIAALLELVGLPSGIAGAWPSALSLGMARRVALARALAVDPDLLVLDEPFASLDPRLAGRLISLLEQYSAERSTTIVFATHELEQALTCADRVLVLAGSPARLAGDVRVPREAHALGEAREALLRQFPFLSAERLPRAAPADYVAPQSN
jgi:ABC-type nitrate/sulfonate/bicarbonate transport system ATPase subunit